MLSLPGEAAHPAGRGPEAGRPRRGKGRRGPQGQVSLRLGHGDFGLWGRGCQHEEGPGTAGGKPGGLIGRLAGCAVLRLSYWGPRPGSPAPQLRPHPASALARPLAQGLEVGGHSGHRWGPGKARRSSGVFPPHSGAAWAVGEGLYPVCGSEPGTAPQPGTQG